MRAELRVLRRGEELRRAVLPTLEEFGTPEIDATRLQDQIEEEMALAMDQHPEWDEMMVIIERGVRT